MVERVQRLTGAAKKLPVPEGTWAIGAGLIVVGSQGMHGAKRVLGSVPNKVSHQARCNVMIVSTDSP